jgi:5,6-dimethylbenzimidazole synthase
VHDQFARCNAESARIYDSVRAEAYAQLKLAGLDAAPVQLAIFTEIDPPEGHGLGRQTMHQTLHQSTAMAVYALWLAARAENLGLGMVSILEPQMIKRLFDAPCHWEFSAYLCLGWPDFADDMPLLHRVAWQENGETLWEIR